MNPMQSPSHDAAKPDLEPDHHHNFRDDDLDGDMLREKCGVFGIFNHPDAAAITALGLHA
ncbi:MAG: amidophosphoribosyltransferase, partial [Tardiphaga sp.]|nr:amidophosphoribosyltransferase [Tardiphaga sp.]